MTALTIDRVWKEYGDQIVLEDIRLDIAPRSFVARVGPSGCGKSTCLRMLLGQETPTRGRILLDGAPLPAEPGPDRGVVYQRYSVFPHLTVLGNVMLGPEMAANRLTGRARGPARRAIADRARALLAEMDLRLALSNTRHPLDPATGPVPAPEAAMDRIHDIPAEKPWSGIVRKGQTLIIIDSYGRQAIDTIFYNARDFGERYSNQDTMRENGVACIGGGCASSRPWGG